jgi:hypothetical protein
MALRFRHIVPMLFILLAAVMPARAGFNLADAKEADKLAESKYFVVNTTQINSYEWTNLSVPFSTSTGGVLLVQSTRRATSVRNDIAVPREFSLSQNFPNPFNMSTKIQFSLPVQSDVSLIVYDVTGREITTLVRGTVPAGTHTAQFDIKEIASGTYYYRMVAVGQSGGTSVETKKMIVMK